MDYVLWVLMVAASAGVLFFVGWAVAALVIETRKNRIPALLYHHFMSANDLECEKISRREPAYFCYDKAFDEQLGYLVREGYTTLSLEDFVAFQEGKKPLPAKPVIITFDDGFVSNYRYAFPLLKKHGLTATVFVTWEPDCGNFKAYAGVDRPMNHAEIKEMSDYGISIESHSMTHPYLSELPEETIRWELAESRCRLEQLLGKPIRYIAIPSGAYNKTVKRLVKEAGYKAAFCMLKGTNGKNSDPFYLRRLVVARDFNLVDFERMLKPAAAIYLRLTGGLQNGLLALLGPGGLDALRDRLYGLGLGALVTRGQLKYFVPCIGLFVIVCIVLFALVLRKPF